jgi:hypothetical protein
LHAAVVFELRVHWPGVGSGWEADVIDAQLQELFTGVPQEPASRIIHRNITTSLVDFDFGRRRDRDHISSG